MVLYEGEGEGEHCTQGPREEGRRLEWREGGREG